jgi:hypothetical protein
MAGEEKKLPLIAYVHRDTDMNDEKLIALMNEFEEDPENGDLVLQLAKHRLEKGDFGIAKGWLKYGREIADGDALVRVEALMKELPDD